MMIKPTEKFMQPYSGELKIKSRNGETISIKCKEIYLKETTPPVFKDGEVTYEVILVMRHKKLNLITLRVKK